MFHRSPSRSFLHTLFPALGPSHHEPPIQEKKAPCQDDVLQCADESQPPQSFEAPHEPDVASSGSTTPTISIPGTPKLDPPSLDIPDGGLDAWLTLAGGWMVTFCTFGYASSFGVYQDYYLVTGTNSSSTISWIGSIQLAFMFMTGLPAGQLFDMGYFRYTSIIGTLLYTFLVSCSTIWHISIFMLSLADTNQYYELILSQGIGMGIGGGLLLVPALSIQTHYWQKRRILAMGVVLTGTSTGGIIYPIMLNRLFNGSTGYAWGVRASAFLTLGLLVFANCIMRPRMPSRKKRPRHRLTMRLVKDLLTDIPYVLAVAGIFLVLWGLFFPYFYLQVWVSSHGLSSNLAFYTVAILNAASVPGRTIPNLLADYFGIFNMACPIAFITGALLFAMFGTTSNGASIVFSILYGFFSGGYIALFPPTMAGFARDMEEVGVRIGVGYFVSSFALLTGTPITGALLGTGQHWAKPIIFSGVVCLAGSVVLIYSRYLLCKRKGTQLV